MAGKDGKRDAERAVVEERGMSKSQHNRRAKKAREAAEAEGCDNVGLYTSDIGDGDIGDGGIVDVSFRLGADTSCIRGGVHVEPLSNVDARAVPSPPYGPHSAF